MYLLKKNYDRVLTLFVAIVTLAVSVVLVVNTIEQNKLV